MNVLSAKLEAGPCAPNDFAATRLVCFAAATVLACCLDNMQPLSAGSGHAVLDATAVVAIAIAVWHGAYDGVLAKPRLEPWLGVRWAPAFAAGYLFLIAATLVAWRVAPAWALVAFLAYSSWHFGTEQDIQPIAGGAAIPAFALGGLPIAAACYWHPEQVSAIFRSMLGAAVAPAFSLHLIHVCAALLWVFVAVTLAGAALGLRGRAVSTRLALLSLVALQLLLFWLCDPVLAFAIYFCLWHTPEHLVSTSVNATGRFSPRVMAQNLRAGMLPWIASLAGLAVLFALRPRSLTGYVSALFVLLSALTVPHMALNELRRIPRR